MKYNGLQKSGKTKINIKHKIFNVMDSKNKVTKDHFEMEEKNKVTITYENIKYGQLVRYYHDHGSYHSGVRVHFFNKKGVLIGNFYKFVEYSKLRNVSDSAMYPRMYMDKPFESVRQFFYEKFCVVLTWLMRKIESVDDFE